MAGTKTYIVTGALVVARTIGAQGDEQYYQGGSELGPAVPDYEKERLVELGLAKVQVDGVDQVTGDAESRKAKAAAAKEEAARARADRAAKEASLKAEADALAARAALDDAINNPATATASTTD